MEVVCRRISGPLGEQRLSYRFLEQSEDIRHGVTAALFLTVPLAYVLSVKTLPGRKILTIFVLLPYLFNVGIIPNYLLVTKLGLTNTLPAIFLPGAISTYYCLIMRGFFFMSFTGTSANWRPAIVVSSFRSVS
ncbi:MAG: hypothetical protein LBB98_12930 [Treponema sp.]|nr:hypothetical protein [Treponema sp.]